MRRHRMRTGLRRSLPVVLLLAASDPASADDRSIGCHGDRGMCETVIAGERALTAMLTSGDVGIVSRLFADDAVWSLADGTRWTKSEAIAALGKAPKMRSSQLLQADVHPFGTTAIVVWKERWRAPAATRDTISFGTDTWMLRAGRWRIVASQEARAPTVQAR